MVLSGLVLDSDIVSYHQGGAFWYAQSSVLMPACAGFLGLPPSRPGYHAKWGGVAPGKYGDEIFAGSSKDALSRGQLCAGISCILVLEYGLCECVGVLVATGNLCYW